VRYPSYLIFRDPVVKLNTSAFHLQKDLFQDILWVGLPAFVSPCSYGTDDWVHIYTGQQVRSGRGWFALTIEMGTK